MRHLLVIFIAICLSGCFGSEPQKTGKEGKPLPNFSLLQMDSTTWLHSRNIPEGKPFVMFYFSPYCSYCKAQTRKIVEDMDMLKDIHFYFVSSFPLSEVKSYYTEFELKKYPNITFCLDSANYVGDYFEVSGFPFLAIYGKNKKLNKTFLGKMYNSQLKKVAEE